MKMEIPMINQNQVTFDSIPIGRKFKTLSNITYQKTGFKKAKPLLKSDGSTIYPQKETTAFYNSKLFFTLL